MLLTHPAVFVVGKEYQISVPVSCETLLWIKVGDECYYDESNGILRSDCLVHKVAVPKEELEKEKKYTVCVRKIIERKSYFTEAEEVVETEYNFYPVTGDNVKAYHISDTHNMTVAPIKVVKDFGKIDFLILNGDIPDHSGTMENIITLYEIASAVTKGEIPIVFARGNHDMRGICAEKFAEITPVENGNSYYTFRIGNIWGIILDCGEDKDDSHEAYGGTICCTAFRKRQTKFIESVIKNAKEEYLAEGVKHRIVVCHNPFTEQLKPPFDIEAEIYSKWASLLKENVKPDMMLCGHMHRVEVNEVGSKADMLGQPCTVVVGGYPCFHESGDRTKDDYTGAGLCFYDDGIKITFTDNKENIVGTYEIKK